MLKPLFVSLKSCLGVLSAALIPVALQASSFTFTTINDPADVSLQTPTFNQLLGINDEGVIAGYYGDGAIINNHGFTYTGGTFTPENVPGTDQTQVVAINNVLSSNVYDTAGFSVINATGLNQGFTNVGGAFTNVNGPGSMFTQVLGLNDDNQAVGFYVAADGNTLPFLYNLGTKSLTTISYPSGWDSTSVTAAGINNDGVIVGFYTDAAGTVFGFIDNGGTFTAPTDPLGTNPMFFGINNNGEIVGDDTAADGATEGFVYNMDTNTWTLVADPSASQVPDGFGISGTTLNGINDQGDLVGFYADASGNVDGLLVTPTPEPTSVGLFTAACMLLCAVWARRRRRSSGC